MAVDLTAINMTPDHIEVRQVSLDPNGWLPRLSIEFNAAPRTDTLSERPPSDPQASLGGAPRNGRVWPIVEKLRELHSVVTIKRFGKLPRKLRIKWAFWANHSCAKSASKYSHPSFSTQSAEGCRCTQTLSNDME